MKEEKPIRVLIADDIEPIRKRCRTILEADDSVEVVADVGTGLEACLMADELKPDVILMDIEMEEKDSGIRAAGQILGKYPEMKIIILTVYEEDELIFSAFQLGACDYILKNAPNVEILSAVKAAFHGVSPIRPEIAGRIRNEFRRVKTYESSFLYMLNLLSSLTPTELDTLYLLSIGWTRQQICESRCVEMSTVKSQVHRILKKFGKRKITEVIQTESDRQLLETIMKNYR